MEGSRFYEDWAVRRQGAIYKRCFPLCKWFLFLCCIIFNKEKSKIKLKMSVYFDKWLKKGEGNRKWSLFVLAFLTYSSWQRGMENIKWKLFSNYGENDRKERGYIKCKNREKKASTNNDHFRLPSPFFNHLSK